MAKQWTLMNTNLGIRVGFCWEVYGLARDRRNQLEMVHHGVTEDTETWHCFLNHR